MMPRPPAQDRSRTASSLEIVRPLTLGLSVGHAEGSGGTLGPFVMVGEQRAFLSTAHVLAPRGARLGEFIHQPSPLEFALTGESRIATLLNVLPSDPLEEGAAPAVGVARLLEDVEIAGNVIPPGCPGAGSELRSPVDQTALAPGDEVGLIGLYSNGIGRIESPRLDPLHFVDERNSRLTFFNSLSIRGDFGPFSRNGDSGAVVYRTRDLAVVGLVFAGTTDDEELTFVLPLAPVFRALGCRLLGEHELERRSELAY